MTLRKKTPVSLARQLSGNLRAGLRLAFFRRVRRAAFSIGMDQAVALALIGIGVDVIADLLRAGSGAEFNVFALPYAAFNILLAVGAAYVVAKVQGKPPLLPGLLVVLMSVAPLFSALQFTWFLSIQAVDHLLSDGGRVLAYQGYYLVVFWYVVVVYRALRLLVPVAARRAAGLAAAYAGIVLLPLFLVPRQDFWEVPYDDDIAPARANVNAEEVFYAQHDMLDARLRHLQGPRKGVSDIYFVGFGAYSDQDVFMREVRSVQQLFDERFGTRGRSLALINNPATVRDMPIASYSNLERALRYLGRLMNTDEDVLFLYITSHGSSDHRLAVDFWPLPLNEIRPEQLKRALDASGIRWKVVVISACYSGGFVDQIKDDHTLVMTSSSASRQSFGCASGNDYTYFGQALFDEGLRSTYSFVDAFRGAAARIAARERREKLVPSEPQLYEPPAVEAKLAVLERRLAHAPPRRPATQALAAGPAPKTAPPPGCARVGC